MAKTITRNSETDAIVVRELNRGLTLNDIQSYTIERHADGGSWLTATLWFQDKKAELAPQRYPVDEDGRLPGNETETDKRE